MNYVGFVQYGELQKYREQMRRAGTPVSFKEGTNVIPFLRKKRSAFYIDKGLLYLRLYKADGGYMQVMAFKGGSMFPLYDMKEKFLYEDVKMLVAARGEVSGFMLPIETYYQWKKEDSQFANLLHKQLAKTTAYLSVSHILYRDGECITRICNLLYHAYTYKDYDQQILPMGQEELAYTVNSSKSQVKRALGQLRQEGGIKLQYAQIIITDIAVIEQYISESARV